MAWEDGRRKEYIPVAVKRAVYHRADGVCEAQRPGCLRDEHLEYHHVIGVGEWEGPRELLNAESNLSLLCHNCHSWITQQQATKAKNSWKLQPERHPGLKR
ncbi:MAG TPA: HNH endonuclease signature motif containing protein [Mycobacterium sp.]|nr:HNH endonuclease signature motif containing protein [Mycobacterium sp.]